MYSLSLPVGLLALTTACSAITANFDGFYTQTAGQTIGVHNGLDYKNFFANSNYFEVTTVLPESYPNRAAHLIKDGIDPVGIITVNLNEFKSFNLGALSYGCAQSEATSGTLFAVPCSLELTAYCDYEKKNPPTVKTVSFAPGPSLVGGLLLSDMARASTPGLNDIVILEIKVVPAALEGTPRYAIVIDNVEYSLNA